MRMGKFYVYDLIDPRTGAPFYVGKGSGDRIGRHEREASSGRLGPRFTRIREIWDAGFEVVRRQVQEFTDELEAYAHEAARISAIGLENLTNLAPGGVGFAHPRRAERARRPPKAPKIAADPQSQSERRLRKMVGALVHVIRCMSQGDGELYYFRPTNVGILEEVHAVGAREVYLNILRDLIEALGIDKVNAALRRAGNVEVVLDGSH